MSNDKDLFDDNFNDHFEDVEQILQPQCEFKASDALKQKVMEKARHEVRPSRIVRMWPWLAAACAVGFLIMFLKPPKTAIEQASKEEQLMAKAIEEKQAISSPLKKKVSIQTTVQPHAESQNPIPHKTRTTAQKSQPNIPKETIEEPVQMSEETRMELLLASLNKDMPPMEEINTEEEIRQIRMRGERLISMYEANDK